jgi:hypothetical protein
MQKITSKTGLENAILLLEAEQAVNWQLLKEQLHLTYNSFRPVNIIKSTFNDIVSSPNLINNILSVTTGMATGYLSKKLVVGASGNIIRKLIGSVLQFGVTSAVVKHPEKIRLISQYILKYLLHKKETNSNQL